MLNRILILLPLTKEHKEKFIKTIPDANFLFAQAYELNNEDLSLFDAIVGNPPIEYLSRFVNLKFIHLSSSGVAPEFIEYAKSRPQMVLCSSSGAYGQAISEHMLAVLLMLIKRLHEYRDDQHQALWIDRGKVSSIRDLSILIIGAGSIGSNFAKLAKALGAKTIGIRRTSNEKDDSFDEMYTIDSLDCLLPMADVITLSLPETIETRDLMNRSRFLLLKKGSYLINVGRGSIVDQDALQNALRTGILAGASIDVTVPEPLPRESSLWAEKNLLITPHISGQYRLKATLDNIVNVSCHNLSIWPSGPYISRVDYATGYRIR